MYLLVDGKMLDGSGYKNGGSRYYRSLDHREICDVYSGDMVDFINEGNIRLTPESPGISLIVEPNRKQYAVLAAYIDYFLFKDSVFYIDFMESKFGETVYSMEFDSQDTVLYIINQIKQYFRNI